jgi:hypothetical protein
MTEDKKEVKITYRTTPENAEVLQQIADEKDWSLSQVNHKIVDDFVHGTKTVEPPAKSADGAEK